MQQFYSAIRPHMTKRHRSKVYYERAKIFSRKALSNFPEIVLL